ncbi:hypothetical protein GJW-30_1_02078 [Variibacter gotjawalensis]|uniref:Uncharacterized protein n=1 Tax=Variibacter gotjawalensis TaxID=1333996 RepID=A0A0S3PUC1_9BRAD|nr:hypothetical protein [Variibacter gotjawalensis]NIK49871.1 hypothetical protein [Variibacter gotjawalensis]RZS45870.1 hypothetical protein EV661_4196 [Variibacter gotjawalensis]BAT59545.1 hypothetical protein GJW-30_1_02078 [Variibacter gotjawalensis]
MKTCVWEEMGRISFVADGDGTPGTVVYGEAIIAGQRLAGYFLDDGTPVRREGQTRFVRLRPETVFIRQAA